MKEHLFDLKSVKAGALIFFFAVMLSAVLITTAVLPWNAFQKLQESCLQPTTAIVVEDCAQEQDGVYYYGPVVEYTNYELDMVYRVSAINTVDLRKEWKEGDALAVYYNTDDPSQLILRDENTAEKRCKMTIIIMSVLCALTLGYFVFTVVLHFKKPKQTQVKVDTNILGESFEEWQAKQKDNENEEQEEQKE